MIQGVKSSAVSPNFAQIALESVAAALVVTDLTGRIHYMNLAASQMVGYTLKETRGLPWRKYLNIIDEDTHRPIADPVSACLATRRTMQLGLCAVLVDKQGAEIPVEGSVAPFCWMGDDVFGTVMMLHDVTPSRKLIRQRLYSVD